MRRYTESGEQAAAADDTILSLASTTAVKPHVYEVGFGSAATPGDQAAHMQIVRFTADGTGTSVTPAPLDPDDPAAAATSKHNHSVEPSGAPYSSGAPQTGIAVLAFSINQQATYRWVTPPEEGIILADTTAGIGMRFDITTGSALYQAMFSHAE